MLVKFSVRNYKQFKDEITFDLSAGNYEFNNECAKNGVVKTALIYGKNGTGKTNLGLAMFDLVGHLTNNESDRLNNNHYKNLVLGNDYIDFKYDFIFDKYSIVYQYSKDNNHIIQNERFFINDELIINYERTKKFEILLKGTEHLNKDMNPKQNLSVLKYIFNNTNLDKRNTKNKTFIKFMDFVNSILWYRNVTDDKSYVGLQTGTDDILEGIIDSGNVEDFESFLNDSDIECKLETIVFGNKKTLSFDFNGTSVFFHDIASTGTKSLALFYYWWQQVKLNNVPLLFIDEFDASYHFKLSKNIVNKLKELPNTQVILTTHNTNLLNNDLIRPDCGFIIDGKQIKALQHCTKRELRHAHNLEKMYKAGSFNV